MVTSDTIKRIVELFDWVLGCPAAIEDLRRSAERSEAARLTYFYVRTLQMQTAYRNGAYAEAL